MIKNDIGLYIYISWPRFDSVTMMQAHYIYGHYCVKTYRRRVMELLTELMALLYINVTIVCANVTRYNERVTALKQMLAEERR